MWKFPLADVPLPFIAIKRLHTLLYKRQYWSLLSSSVTSPSEVRLCHPLDRLAEEVFLTEKAKVRSLLYFANLDSYAGHKCLLLA